jgi:hypothetical protein
MNRLTLCFAVASSYLTISCASTSRPTSSQCTVHDIDEIMRDAVQYAGGVFCGDVFAVEYGRTVRFLRAANEMPPSADLAMLVTSDTRILLIGLSDKPKRFYVEARIDPMKQCFVPSGSGEDCSPYRRPIRFRILSAKRRP